MCGGNIKRNKEIESLNSQLKLRKENLKLKNILKNEKCLTLKEEEIKLASTFFLPKNSKKKNDRKLRRRFRIIK